MNIIYHFRVRGGGAEGVHISGIIKALRAMGHNVFPVSPTGIDPTKPAPGRRSRRLSRILHFIADHAAQWLFEIMELFYNFYAIARLRRAVTSHDGRVIYERYAFFNIAGVLTARRLDLPLILEVNELSGLPRVRPQTWTGLAGYFERKILAQASLIVAVSPFLARRIIEISDAPAANIMVAPNGVDAAWVDADISAESRLELIDRLGLDGRTVIGFVGGLVHWHKLEALLNSMPELLKNGFDPVILLIGDGPLRNRLEITARELGIVERLIVTGALPHDEVRKHLNILDLAVIPHSNEYRSPIKLFEYMGAGCAVVAPCTEPIEAVIEDGVDGRLFNPLDFRRMTTIMTELLKNPEQCRQLGENARRKIKEKYLWNQHAKHIIKRLEETLKIS